MGNDGIAVQSGEEKALADIRRRLIACEGAAIMEAWHAVWDEAEDLYFTRIRPAASFDLVVTG